MKTTFCVTRFSTHGPNLHSSMASMLACAACTRSLPAEQFVKAQVKKGPQKMRCKACVTAEAPLPVAVVPEAEAVSVAAPSEEQVSPPPLSPPPLSPTLLPTAVPCRALALLSADPPPRAPGRQEHGRGHGAAGGERREGAAQGRLGHPAKSTLGQVTDQEGGTAARSKRRLRRRRSCTYGRRPLSPGGAGAELSPGGARTYRVAGGVRTGSKRRLSSAELGSCASCASCGSGRPMTPRVRGPG